jgi:aspartate aminotransferase
MKGFYNVKSGETNPGSTQFRISFVETPDKMAKVPELFVKLLRQFEAQR